MRVILKQLNQTDADYKTVASNTNDSAATEYRAILKTRTLAPLFFSRAHEHSQYTYEGIGTVYGNRAQRSYVLYVEEASLRNRCFKDLALSIHWKNNVFQCRE